MLPLSECFKRSFYINKDLNLCQVQETKNLNAYVRFDVKFETFPGWEGRVTKIEQVRTMRDTLHLFDFGNPSLPICERSKLYIIPPPPLTKIVNPVTFI